ncbi:hypothetical protein Plec18167_006155 [Paecilomyces lecythidis]|uniref:Uncharacterized protein n=1 Tax=Paecilomyces lecythidis TaxID=3004212 RepID=A0ABR3XCH9_9EURO
MDRHINHHLHPIAEEITPIDHQILHNGGSSSKIERLPSRLQQSKNQRPADAQQEIEDLAYENSYLRAELMWTQESRQALLEFHEETFKLFRMMEEALVEIRVRLERSDERYLKLWGIEERKSVNGGRF